MKKEFYYSQKRFLFIIYGLLVTALLSVFFIYFYFSYKNNIIKDAEVKIESISTSIKNSLTDQLDNMSTISMNIVYSNAIKKNFTSFSRYYNTTNGDSLKFIDLRENVLSLYDIITAIIGTFQSATQVNLYTLNGVSIGSGYFQGINEVNVKDFPWYDETMAKNGFKHISEIDNLPNSGSYIENSKYLTLTRLFFNKSNEPEGIVEVIQDYKIVFDLLSELQQKNPDTSFYIYNEKNELIYPYKNNINIDVDYLNLIEENNLSPVSAEFIKTDDKNE